MVKANPIHKSNYTLNTLTIATITIMIIILTFFHHITRANVLLDFLNVKD